MNTKFEAQKLECKLLQSGKEFIFYVQQINKFGEPVENSQEELEEEDIGEEEEESTEFSIRGIYHEVNAYIGIDTKNTTQVRETVSRYKKQPRILCLWKSIVESNIKIGDYTMINGKRFNVTGVTNVQEWNIIADISLEVVDDGNQVSL